MGRLTRIVVGGRKSLTCPPSSAVSYPNAVFETVTAGTHVRRIYDPGRYGATAAGLRSNGPHARFDHQRRPGPFPAFGDDPDRRILYCAFDFDCAVSERFGDDGVIDPNDSSVAVLEITKSWNLLDVRKAAARAVGTIPAIAGDGDRAVTQDWARHWYEHPDLKRANGLLFESAQSGLDAVALTERAEGTFSLVFDAPLTDPTVFKDVLLSARRLHMILLPPRAP